MKNNQQDTVVAIQLMTTAGHMLHIIDALQDEADDAAWAKTAVKRDLNSAIKALTKAYNGMVETARRFQ